MNDKEIVFKIKKNDVNVNKIASGLNGSHINEYDHISGTPDYDDCLCMAEYLMDNLNERIEWDNLYYHGYEGGFKYDKIRLVASINENGDFIIEEIDDEKEIC